MKRVNAAKTSWLFNLLFIGILMAGPCFSQIDTLHLYYKGLDAKMPDTTESKIVSWAKKLDGRHVDITIVAYYSQSEFKKLATERADEMFLIMNRKARSLITIKTYEARKGQKSQRSLVDVIYTPTESAVKTTTLAPKKEEENKIAVNEPQKTVAKTFVAKEEIKARKLLIVLLSENKTELERLSKKVNTLGLEAYKKGIKIYNENITSAFKKSWTVSSVETINEDELTPAVVQEKATDYVFLLPGKKQSAKMNFVNCKVVMPFFAGKTLDVTANEFKVSIPDNLPREYDFMVLINKIKVFYGIEKQFDRTQLEEVLAAKTLYVDTAQTRIPEIEFREEYTFPVKFADGRQITELLKKKDDNALYLKPDVYTGVINLMVVEASTGNILSRGTVSSLIIPSVKMPEGLYGSSASLDANGSQLSYKACSACSFGMGEHADLYTIPKGLPKIISNEKKQTVFNPLISN